MSQQIVENNYWHDREGAFTLGSLFLSNTFSIGRQLSVATEDYQMLVIDACVLLLPNRY